MMWHSYCEKYNKKVDLSLKSYMRLGVTNKIDLTSPRWKIGREKNATWLGIMAFLKLRNKDQKRQGGEKYLIPNKQNQL